MSGLHKKHEPGDPYGALIAAEASFLTSRGWRLLPGSVAGRDARWESPRTMAVYGQDMAVTMQKQAERG